MLTKGNVLRSAICICWRKLTASKCHIAGKGWLRDYNETENKNEVTKMPDMKVCEAVNYLRCITLSHHHVGFCAIADLPLLQYFLNLKHTVFWWWLHIMEHYRRPSDWKLFHPVTQCYGDAFGLPCSQSLILLLIVAQNTSGLEKHHSFKNNAMT